MYIITAPTSIIIIALHTTPPNNFLTQTKESMHGRNEEQRQRLCSQNDWSGRRFSKPACSCSTSVCLPSLFIAHLPTLLTLFLPLQSVALRWFDKMNSLELRQCNELEDYKRGQELRTQDVFNNFVPERTLLHSLTSYSYDFCPCPYHDRTQFHRKLALMSVLGGNTTNSKNRPVNSSEE